MTPTLPTPPPSRSNRWLLPTTAPLARALSALFCVTLLWSQTPPTSPIPESDAFSLWFDHVEITDTEVRLAISFHADAQHNYVVEYSNDVQPGAPCDAWRPVAFAPHNYGIVFLTNQISTPSRHYRLRRIEQPFTGLHALLLNDTGDNALDGLTSDPAISGLVVPSQPGLELQASLDAPDGPFATLQSIPRRQHFRLEREQLDQLAGGLLNDGAHVLHLRTATAAGQQVSSFAVPFHLDTTPPQILLETDPPLGGVGLAEGSTIRETITLLARTEPGLRLELVGTPWAGEADPDGWLRFESLPLALGANLLRLRTLDLACNEGFAELTVTRVSSAGCLFADDLQGWHVDIAPPLTGHPPGTVTAGNCVATLTEGDSFVVALGGAFTTPATPAVLEVQFLGPTFDSTSTGSIKDAFEIAVVDDAGQPLTYVIAEGRDVCFNLTEGQANAATAQGVMFTRAASGTEPSTVSISLAHLFPGQPFHLICRLVNNDGDPGSTVHLVNVALTAQTHSGILLASGGPPSLTDGLQPASDADLTQLRRVRGPGLQALVGRVPSRGGPSDVVYAYSDVGADALARTPVPGTNSRASSRHAIALASDPSPSSGSSLFSLTVNPPPAQMPAGNTILLTGQAALSRPVPSLPDLDLVYGLKGRNKERPEEVVGIPTHLISFRAKSTTFQDHGIITLEDEQIYVDGLALSSVYGLVAFQFVEGGQGSRLVALDVANTHARVIGPFLAGREIRGAAFDLCENLWAIDSAKRQLVRLDPVTGEVLDDPLDLHFDDQPGELWVPLDVAVDRYGNLYMSDWDHGMGSGAVSSLDLTTGRLVELMRDTTSQPNGSDSPVPGGLAFLATGGPYDAYIFDGASTDDVYLYEGLSSARRTTLFTVMLNYNAGPLNLASLMPPVKRSQLARVTVNDRPVEALDPTGQFFSRVTIAPGRNDFTVSAVDACGQAVSTTVSVLGTHPTDSAVEFSVLSDVSSSLTPEWGRTSFNEDAKTLFADLAIRNTGQYPVQTPLLIGITRLSDPSVRVLNADGLTPDGISYFDFSSLITDPLITDHSTGARTLAFSNPRRTQFTFEVVVLGLLNRPPAFTTVPVIEAIVGQPYSYAFEAVDPDGDPLAYSLSSNPSGLTLNPQPRSLNWSPSAGDVGTHNIRLRAEDGHGGWAEQFYVLSVTQPPPNRPPYFTSLPVVEAFVNRPYLYNVVAADPDNDPLSFTLAQAPDGVALGSVAPSTPSLQPLAWSPTAAAVGNHTVALQVSDGRGGTATQSYVVRVLPDPANHLPVIVSEPVSSGVVGQPYAYDVQALDADNDPLRYSLVGPPAGMTVDAASGLISWQPAADAPGSHALAVRVEDGRGGSDEQQFTINVALMPILPDLIVGNVNRDRLTVEPQTLAALGSVTATVTNLGPGTVSSPFEILFFEDVNHNNVYDPGADTPLSTSIVQGPLANGASAEVSAQIAANVTSPGAFIWAFVDSENATAEENEQNNVAKDVVRCEFVPSVGTFNPAVKWRKDTFAMLPDSNQVIMTPTVVDLDSNGIPEVVFTTIRGESALGRLRAVSGTDGHEIWSVTSDNNGLSWEGQLAAGDIDDDGLPEIVGVHSTGVLIAFEHDGSLKWRGSVRLPTRGTRQAGGPVLANLIGDKSPEIVFGSSVFSRNGALIWNGLANGGVGMGDNNGRGSLSAVADLDLDGSPEVVAGCTAYRANGQVFWNASAPDGFVALGQFDADQTPEIVLIGGGSVYVIEHDGMIKWGPVALPGGGTGGPPTIGDLDGDGAAEIGVAGATRYVVLGSDGSVRWSQPIQDASSAVTGSSVFDFDGDGMAEVVYGDEISLFIFRGIDGHVLYQLPKSSGTVYEYPVVADVDGNGHADIVAAANKVNGRGSQAGIFVIADANDTWAVTRTIWNQHTYHINNVNDDGTIPAHEEPSWLTHNTYRLNAQPAGLSPHSAPDLEACFVRLTEARGQTTITARIGNGGEVLVGPGIKVAFYNGDPKSGGASIGLASTTARIEPGMFEDVRLTIIGPPPAAVWVVADDDGTGEGQVNECNETNNTIAPGEQELRYGSISGLVYADVQNDGKPFASTTINLGFETFPSAQGWVYFNQDDVEETNIFKADGQQLIQTSFDQPLPPDNTDHGSYAYDLLNVVGREGFLSFMMRARVLRTKGYENQNIGGFGVFISTGPKLFYFSPQTNAVFVPGFPGWKVKEFTGSAVNDFHDYHLVVTPPNDARLYVDGELVATNDQVVINYDPPQRNRVMFGDLTHDQDADAEIEKFMLTQWESAAPDPGLPGFVVYLDTNDNQVRDGDERFTLTDHHGGYRFVGLAPGTHRVRQEPQPGWQVILPDSGRHVITLSPGQVLTDVNFANRQVVVPGPNHPPSFGSTAPLEALADEAYIYHARAADPDGDVLTFELTSNPPGMAVDPVSGAVVWTPTNSQMGIYSVVLRVKDPYGALDVQWFEIHVSRRNTPPQITSLPTGPAVVGQLWQYVVHAQDAENDPITFHLVRPRAGMTVSGATITWTPGAGDVGSPRVEVLANDGLDSTTQGFDLPVLEAVQNRPPTITSTPGTSVRLGTAFLYQVEASDPDNEPLTFSLVAVPAGMAFAAEQPANPNQRLITWTPTAGQVGPHTVDVQVQDSRGLMAGQRFTVTVAVQASNKSPSIASQPPQAATVGELYRYDAVASDPDGDLLLWSLETFPSGMSVDPAAGTIRWTPALDQLGLQDVRLRVADGQGGSSAQTYQVWVRAVNLPPSITSAPLTTAATAQLYTYAVQASDPDGDTLTFSLTTKPEGMTIESESGFVEWTPTADQLGTIAVVIRVEDGRGGVAEQSYDVVVSAEAPNQAPVITSDPPALAAVGAPYTYAVTATDPDGDTLTFRLLAFPPGMTINASSGLVQWAPGGEHLGSHTVTVAAVDPNGAGGTQTFAVTVVPLNDPPTITSLPPQVIPAGTPYRYDVRATDPDGDPLTYALTGPVGMAIDQVGRVTWEPQVADAGEHLVAITVTDPLGEYVEQRYNLVVTADTTPPFVRIGRGADRLPVGAILEITAVATDNSGQVSLVLTIGGVPVPLDARGYAEVVLNAVGTFEVLAVATDPAGNVGRDSYSLTVFEQVTDPDFPVLEITAPATDAVITAPVPVVGTASDANLSFYMLEVGLLAGGPLTEIGRGTASVVNGVLGRLDPTTLANDSYRLVLTAQDAGGNVVSTETSFEVAGELKIGNFTLSFVDLSIPVTGIPITVGRTYDSLNAWQPGEFGYGWRLEFREANLRNNLPPRQEYEVEFGIYPAFTERTRVYVTVPGGRRQGFTFKPAPMSGFASMFGFYKPAFQPDAGVTSELTVPAGPNVVLRYDNSSGTYQAVDSNGGTTAYNPEDPAFGGVYTLTTKEGVAYRIDAATRLVTQVFDATGNTLTFTDAAVISSAGPRVDFTRDPQGRITAVKDPAGKSIQYQYDSRGDLVAVTDREGNQTQFKYENPRPHYLTEVIDPLGRSGVRTEYDAQGRLVKLKDAAGNPVELIHDLDHSLEQVVDALGNTNTFVYDPRGNVVREINPLGGVTRREYDLNNNMTIEVDSIGNTNQFTYDGDANVLTRTDPLGNVTLNTYTRIYPRSWFNFTGRTITLLATTTDPLGNTTKNDYDTAGNLVASTDALGKVTRYEYDGAGNQTKITGVAGNVTQFAYDGAGRLTRQTDALGHVTTFTYDANGNQITQASTLTTSTGPKSLVTSTTYDANGRPTSVTDAAGNVTKTEYDALGKTKATVDGLNHRTEFEYDERGQLVRTVFADDTFSQLAYDAAGRRTSSTDRAGRTTDYEYDPLGRLVRTTYPATEAFPLPLGGGEGQGEGEGEGESEVARASTSTTYDLAGRVIAQTDELGHTTSFGYDAAGRQTSITNALGAVTRSEYDTAGRKIADLDALGRRTQYAYDALGRRVKTTFADNTTKQTTYDALGRVTAETDQAGVKTQFEYDALGRLTAVVDALNSRTEYAYNEQGQLVRQQDANGHVTQYEYETCCQRSATILPLGQRSTTQYNQVNNVSSVTDFNGRTISFDYDLNNRLRAKRFPDGTATEFAYTATGRRQNITDRRGVTTFEYDDRDRLLQRTDPDGRFVAYTYDAAGNRTSVITATGTTLYAFDDLNRLASVTDTDGGVTRYTYGEANNVQRIELPNGTVRINTYDPLNRVNDIQHLGPGGVFASFRYTMGPTGNRTEVREHDGRVVNYTYDALYRLVREAITDPVAGNRTIAYTMDPVGNRLTRDDSAEGLTTYTYDANDQLLTEFSSGIGYPASGILTTYAYDQNGNTLSRSNANESTEYDWDPENRLVGFRRFDASHSPLATGHYAYDSDGIRVSKTVTEAANTETTTYLIDANRPYAQVLEEWQSLNAQPSTPNATYTYGRHQPVSQLRAGVRSYYHADHLGSTRALTGQTGNSTDRYVFDAYGRPLSKADLTENAYLFAGEQRDRQLGLDYLRARYVDPHRARFCSRDPLRRTLQRPYPVHAYVYAAGAPVDRVDPSGHVPILAAIAPIAPIPFLFTTPKPVFPTGIIGDLQCADPSPSGTWEDVDKLPTFDCPSEPPVSRTTGKMYDECGNSIEITCRPSVHYAGLNAYEAWYENKRGERKLFGVCPYDCGKNYFQHMKNRSRRAYIAVRHRSDEREWFNEEVEDCVPTVGDFPWVHTRLDTVLMDLKGWCRLGTQPDWVPESNRDCMGNWWQGGQGE